MSSVAIIGSGFSGLSAAAYLAAAGHEVHIYEKNATIGGRARQFTTTNGYVFDMGPSWYWMPDVFEKFFADFGHSVADFYQLKLLDPAFDVVYPGGKLVSIPADLNALYRLFESIEPGSAEKLRKFLSEAKYKYETGMENLVYKPGISLSEFADPKLISGVFRLQVFSSFSRHVRKYFTNPKLITLMEFPVLFLGAMPEETPALYSLMNYAGLALGTWYPMGGFGKVIEAMSTVAVNQGATLHLNAPVDQIRVHHKRASHLLVNGENIAVDAVIGAADYHHIESRLLPDAYRNYPESYWNKKTFAPSCLIFYLGINKRIKNIKHHTLFFDADFRQHAINIYKDPKWPQNPLFYVCCPSQTDPDVAPLGHENLFLLMPIAPGLKDSTELREQYFHIMMDRLENQVQEKLISHIDYKRSYCVHDFISDYNAFKGNAYGLANTLMQTAHLKPKIINKKLPNLFYAGQLTVPGPGVPPSIISGKIAATQAIHHLKETTYEVHI